MSGYSEGVRVEHAVIHDLTKNGYECTRAASSKGVADVIGIKPGQIVLVNVKRTKPPGPSERSNLVRVAGYVNAVPLVATRPLGCKLRYRLLTGAGPRDWTSWTPDEIGDVT